MIITCPGEIFNVCYSSDTEEGCNGQAHLAGTAQKPMSKGTEVPQVPPANKPVCNVGQEKAFR